MHPVASMASVSAANELCEEHLDMQPSQSFWPGVCRSNISSSTRDDLLGLSFCALDTCAKLSMLCERVMSTAVFFVRDLRFDTLWTRLGGDLDMSCCMNWSVALRF